MCYLEQKTKKLFILYHQGLLVKKKRIMETPTSTALIPGHTSKSALFQPIPCNDSEQYVSEVEYQPQSSVIGNFSTIEFMIKETDFYLDLSQTTLSVTVRIIKADGGQISSSDDVSLCNNSLWSLFGSVEAIIGSVNVNPISAPLVSIKSYIDTILTRDSQAQASQLQAQGYFKDTSGFVDVASAHVSTEKEESGSNRGLNLRHEKTRGGKLWQLEGLVPVDTFGTNRYLLFNVPLHLKFRQNPDSFRLMTDNVNQGYTVQFTNVALRVRRVKMSPPLVVGHVSALEDSDNVRALYPHYQSVFRTYPIAQNDMSFSVDNLFNNNVPSKLYMVLIPSKSLNGCYDRSPYNFQSAGVQSIEISLDGSLIPGGRPIFYDFTQNMFVQGYLNLFKTMHCYGGNGGCDLDMDDFANGFFIACYDFDSTPLTTDYFPKQRKGHLRVNIVFQKGLSEPMTLVCYARFPRCLEIDRYRRVTLS